MTPSFWPRDLCQSRFHPELGASYQVPHSRVSGFRAWGVGLGVRGFRIWDYHRVSILVRSMAEQMQNTYNSGKANGGIVAGHVGSR